MDDDRSVERHRDDSRTSSGTVTERGGGADGGALPRTERQSEYISFEC